MRKRARYCHSIGISASYAETLFLDYTGLKFCARTHFFLLEPWIYFAYGSRYATIGIYALKRKILLETWIFFAYLCRYSMKGLFALIKVVDIFAYAYLPRKQFLRSYAIFC